MSGVELESENLTFRQRPRLTDKVLARPGTPRGDGPLATTRSPIAPRGKPGRQSLCRSRTKADESSGFLNASLIALIRYIDFPKFLLTDGQKTRFPLKINRRHTPEHLKQTHGLLDTRLIWTGGSATEANFCSSRSLARKVSSSSRSRIAPKNPELGFDHWFAFRIVQR